MLQCIKVKNNIINGGMLWKHFKLKFPQSVCGKKYQSCVTDKRKIKCQQIYNKLRLKVH